MAGRIRMQSFSLVQAGEEWQVQQLGRLVDMPSPALASAFSGNGAVSFQASLASAISQDSYVQKVLAGKDSHDRVCAAERTWSEPYVVPDSPKQSSQANFAPFIQVAAVLSSNAEHAALQQVHTSVSQVRPRPQGSAPTYHTSQPAVSPSNGALDLADHRVPSSLSADIQQAELLQPPNLPDATLEQLPGTLVQAQRANAPAQHCNMRPAEFDIFVDAPDPSRPKLS
ncbi:TPA: hypothetical protein ACH3X2_003425 [Trebouxia sp. C0005]